MSEQRIVYRRRVYRVRPQWRRSPEHGADVVAWSDGRFHRLPEPGPRGSCPRALYVARVELAR